MNYYYNPQMYRNSRSERYIWGGPLLGGFLGGLIGGGLASGFGRPRPVYPYPPQYPIYYQYQYGPVPPQYYWSNPQFR